MANHRHSVTIPIRVSQYPMLTRLATDPSLRVMVFCAAGCRGPEDIAFPHQSEVKVNGGEVKANLRGLKNKPGSTRPVDITKELRLKIPQYTNNVELTYALTSKVDGGSHVSCLPPSPKLRAFISPLLYPLATHFEIHCADIFIEILSPPLPSQNSIRPRFGEEAGDWTTNN
jgi:hypothetical protein